MADLLIRNIAPRALERLKAQARRHGRSLSSEAKHILEQAVAIEPVTAILARWKKRFADRTLSSSVTMIRNDRQR
jgi:plasmid stability protein